MKPIYQFLLLGVLLSSCKKFLTETPNNALPAGQSITDVGTARAAILGAYDGVQNYYAGNYPTLGVMPADNVIFNGTLSQYLQLDQNAIPADNVTTVAAYQGIYKAINAANSVIAYVPGVNDPQLTAAEKSTILGEAYFIRALGYFDLGRGWGGVQLQLAPTKDLSGLKGVKRSSLEDTYKQVQADLNIAEGLLPEDASTRNRAQKSAARALHARLDLYRGNWDSAEIYASAVIANAKYSLVRPYSSFFTSPFLSAESVFELTFSANDRNSYWNLWYPSSAGGQYTLKPSASIVSRLNDPAVGGSRKALIAGSGSSVYGVLYNTSATSTDPSYVIRIAELYLIRAEARAQQGKLALALGDLNAVRARADVGPSAAVSASDVLQAIEDENSVEFAFEAHRWFDLVRTKRAGVVLGLTNSNAWLFPLPLSDVLSDPDLEGKNNPGY
ncbi:MAG: RagB/SusD family nutrient uptake outer membrane protein [Bacteroidetes bacterium]|nr:RagB/SusD family nutrient uptake outer membrane protein [Bacteroidota bacterium]